MRRDRRKAPTSEEIEAEAAAFHAVAGEFMSEMAALRVDLASTATELAAFAEQLRRMSRG